MPFTAGPIADITITVTARGTRVQLASIAAPRETLLEQYNELGAALIGYISHREPDVFAINMRRVKAPHQVWLHDRLMRAGFTITTAGPDTGSRATTPKQEC